MLSDSPSDQFMTHVLSTGRYQYEEIKNQIASFDIQKLEQKHEECQSYQKLIVAQNCAMKLLEILLHRPFAERGLSGSQNNQEKSESLQEILIEISTSFPKF